MSDFNRYVTTQPGSPKIRTRFAMPHRHLTTMNASFLYPMARWEVLPGDTFTIDMSAVVRMQTPIHPVMDNCYLDVYFFFVPNRLVWDHWKEFMGESTDGFLPKTEYEEPHYVFGGSGVAKGSIYEKLGIPQGYKSPTSDHGPSQLPFRAYALCWNDWFRDQNVSSELWIDKGDSVITLSDVFGDTESWLDYPDSVPDDDYPEDMVMYWEQGRPLPVAKFHDLFTSALPLPQRGPAVSLPLDSIYESGIPVTTTNEKIPGADLSGDFNYNHVAMAFQPLAGGSLGNGLYSLGVKNNTLGFYGSGDINSNFNEQLFPDNLWAQTQFATIGIETFRQAYALQRLYEREARSGSRYTELIRSAYGVVSPDARQQRPELLGLRRIPITMAQVVQQSATNETSPQGNTAAYSLTQDKSSYFTYSSTEHGNILCLACIRTDHTYQQGLAKEWTRRRRFDYHDPVFNNLGEQPIRTSELYAFGNAETQDAVFGYQEAWYEYRNKSSYVSGEMSSLYAQSLDVWHYGDEFTEAPTLSPQFIYETRENLDRTLAVDSNTADQFLCDFYFDTVATRPLPLYSVPGLSGVL